ncbi:MAG: hypothetical protein FWD23_17700 [Oscillospiraceae bacterium]|nr:hypothetical protein [Oscillospiraceae bacterium]
MNVSKVIKKQLEELDSRGKNANAGELIPTKPRINMREGIEKFNNSQNQKSRTFRHHTVSK